MKNLFNFEKDKTWDGLRWLFILLAIVFGAICVRLATKDMTISNSLPLLLVPATFCIGCLALALLASDKVLLKVTSWV